MLHILHINRCVLSPNNFFQSRLTADCNADYSQFLNKATLAVNILQTPFLVVCGLLLAFMALVLLASLTTSLTLRLPLVYYKQRRSTVSMFWCCPSWLTADCWQSHVLKCLLLCSTRSSGRASVMALMLFPLLTASLTLCTRCHNASRTVCCDHDSQLPASFKTLLPGETPCKLNCRVVRVLCDISVFPKRLVGPLLVQTFPLQALPVISVPRAWVHACSVDAEHN